MTSSTSEPRGPSRKAVSRWAEVGDPRTMDPGADLMLLHPDGSEEVLVPVQPTASRSPTRSSRSTASGSTTPSFTTPSTTRAADIYKVHVATRKIVRLTEQAFTPNTGAADWSKTPLPSGASTTSALPGARRQGRLRQQSQRLQGDQPRLRSECLALQLFVMDDDGSNVERIGHLNLGRRCTRSSCKDGRIMFSSLESQGLRSIACGASGASIPTAPTGSRSSAPSTLGTAPPTPSTSRRSCPTAASSSSSTTT